MGTPWSGYWDWGPVSSGALAPGGSLGADVSLAPPLCTLETSGELHGPQFIRALITLGRGRGAGNALPGVKFRARHSKVVRAGEGRRTLGVSKLEPHQIHFAPAIRGDPAEKEAAAGSGAERGGGLGAGTEGVTRSNWKGAKPLPALAPPRLRARAQHSAWGSPTGSLRPGCELSLQSSADVELGPTPTRPQTAPRAARSPGGRGSGQG